ncbi:MAG TPA: folate-binding protein [Acetobacteraceae bacterium]|nr:folate-binding protein [Acetobacteraceae bacterium]
MSRLALLPDRAVLAIDGEDRVGFLQGLVSNDVADAAPGRAVWAALLTPQGKYLADFFVLADGERLLLDCDAAQAAMLAPRLARFRLRSRVAIAPVPLAVHAAWDGVPDEAAIMGPDPRLPQAGFRVLAAAPLAATADAADWDRHRLALGLPEPRDLEPEKSVLLEAGFDELHGVSWAKGCYMGQELTARTKYRGLVKRRLVPVSVSGPLPPPGSAVTAAGREVGTMRSGRDDRGMALLRIEAIGQALACEAATLAATVPDWMRLPEPAG